VLPLKWPSREDLGSYRATTKKDMKPLAFENDADTARNCVDELISWVRRPMNEESMVGTADCRGELFLCIDHLEEEIRRLRREIEDLTDYRRDDPHP